MGHEQPTVLDLFAGCGGLSLGLERAGFVPVGFTEIAEEAAQTYLHNRPKHEWLTDNWVKDTWDLIRPPNGKSGEIAKQKPLQKIIKTAKQLNPGARGSGIDLVVGGPPCQGYSRLGHRRTYGHDRKSNPSNFLYESMAGVIALTKPKFFVFENVQGLLRATWERGKGEPGEVFEDVLRSFVGIRDGRSSKPLYEVRWKLVRAYQFGVPQNRPRVLAVGIRRDIAKDLDRRGLICLDRGNLKKSDRLQDKLQATESCHFFPQGFSGPECPHPDEAIGDLLIANYEESREAFKETKQRELLKSDRYFEAKPTNTFQREMRNQSEARRFGIRWDGQTLKNHEGSFHADKTIARFKAIQKAGRAEGENRNKKFSQRALPRQWKSTLFEDRVPNITVTSMPDDFVHYEQARSMTVREWARLQTFPDWYEFLGKRTTGGIRRAGDPESGIVEREVPQYTQIGNAVPPRLAFAIGQHLRPFVDKGY